MIRKFALPLIAAMVFPCLAAFCQSAGPDTTEPKSVPDLRSELAVKLLTVKRIYVESFGDDEISKSLQAMVINALDESKRFIVTENKEKADAILKGRSVEKTSQEVHATGEGTSVATAAGATRRACRRLGEAPTVASRARPWALMTPNSPPRPSTRRAWPCAWSPRMAT